MQTLQKQLPAKSPERKCLFNLLDAHIYKKSGDYLEAAGSLIQFVSDGLKYQLNLHSFYYQNFLDMALVLLLATKGGEMVIPYEYAKYLSTHFWGMDDALKKEFRDQVDQYFKEEDENQEMIHLKLPLSHPISSLASDPSLLPRYTALLTTSLSTLQTLLTSSSSPSLVHTYLFTLTALVNEPQLIAKQQSSLISSILGHLNQEELIDEESCLIYGREYQGKYEKFAQEFMSGAWTYFEQNEVLMIEKRATQQSIWVKVEIKGVQDGKEGEKTVKEALKRADLEEARMIQKLDTVASKFQIAYQLFKNTKDKVKRKYSPVPIDHRLLVSTLLSAHNLHSPRIAYRNIELLKKSQQVSNYIRVVTLNSRFETIIDLHYLLSLTHRVHNVMLPQVLSEKEYLLADNENDEPLETQFNHIMDQVHLWSESKQSHTDGQGGAFARNQRILKLKWKEQAMRVKQKLLAKVQAKKREDAQVKKKIRIKMFQK